jgi:hypothetical protein
MATGNLVRPIGPVIAFNGFPEGPQEGMIWVRRLLLSLGKITFFL